MFELAKYYHKYWKNRSYEMFKSKYYRECFSQKPIPVLINIDQMKNQFKEEFNSSEDIMKHYLPESILKDLKKIVSNEDKLDAELWAEIVYNYAASYKKIEQKADKYFLMDSLKTLWIGRFVSYAQETKDMDINQAEQVLQKQAEVFEGKFDYLRSIY